MANVNPIEASGWFSASTPLVVGSQSSNDKQKYTKANDVIDALVKAGFAGSWQCEGLSTDVFSCGEATITGLTSVIINNTMLYVSSPTQAFSCVRGQYIKGNVSLSCTTLESVDGITVSNISFSDGTADIGSPSRPAENVFAQSINGHSMGGTLKTKAQGIIEAINELASKLGY